MSLVKKMVSMVVAGKDDHYGPLLYLIIILQGWYCYQWWWSWGVRRQETEQLLARLTVGASAPTSHSGTSMGRSREIVKGKTELIFFA